MSIYEPITNDVQRLAVFYKEALEEEFPQYQYYLTFSDRAFLRVDTVDAVDVTKPNPTMTILLVWFSPRRARIAYCYLDYGHVDYADPEFTEDILSKILRAHHAD